MTRAATKTRLPQWHVNFANNIHSFSISLFLKNHDRKAFGNVLKMLWNKRSSRKNKLLSELKIIICVTVNMCQQPLSHTDGTMSAEFSPEPSVQNFQSISMAPLWVSLETISLISFPWSFSIFFTSWAWSVLYCRHCRDEQKESQGQLCLLRIESVTNRDGNC